MTPTRRGQASASGWDPQQSAEANGLDVASSRCRIGRTENFTCLGPHGEDRPATFRVAQAEAQDAVGLRVGSGQLDVSGHRHLVTPSAR